MKKSIKKIILCSLLIPISMQASWVDSLANVFGRVSSSIDAATTRVVNSVGKTIGSLSDKQLGVGAAVVASLFVGYKLYQRWSHNRRIVNATRMYERSGHANIAKQDAMFNWSSVAQVFFNQDSSYMIALYENAQAKMFKIQGRKYTQVGEVLDSVQSVKWHAQGQYVFVSFLNNIAQVYNCSWIPVGNRLENVVDAIWHPVEPIYFAQSTVEDFILLNLQGIPLKESRLTEVSWSPDGLYLYCKVQGRKEHVVVKKNSDIPGDEYRIVQEFSDVVDFAWRPPLSDSTTETIGCSVVVYEWKNPNSWNPLNRIKINRAKIYDGRFDEPVTMIDDVDAVSWDYTGQFCILKMSSGDFHSGCFVGSDSISPLLRSSTENEFTHESFGIAGIDCMQFQTDNNNVWFRKHNGSCKILAGSDIDLPHNTTQVFWSGDRALAVVNNQDGYLYNINTGEQIAVYPGCKNSCIWSQDGFEFFLKTARGSGLYRTYSGEKIS